MARWIGRAADFHCFSCNRRWDGFYYTPCDTAAYLADIGDRVYRENQHKLVCICPSPHVEVTIRSNSHKYAQVRASQRAVIYEHADGSWQAPGSNDPTDSVAIRAAQDGAVRREFGSLREMESYFRTKSAERGLHPHDLAAPSNEISDFDESKRRQEDTVTRSRQATRDREANLRLAANMLGIGRGNSGKYDKALRERDRRR